MRNAAYYYQLAANQGDEKAQFQNGVCLANDDDVSIAKRDAAERPCGCLDGRK
jgi:TPR repeat protein